MTFEFTPTRQKNFSLAQQASLIKHQELKQKRIADYYLNPKLCSQCNKPIDYNKQANKFCSKSCSATHNNPSREYKDKTKQKISATLKGHVSPFKNKNGGNSKFCKVCFKQCPTCDKFFYTHGMGEKYGRKIWEKNLQ